MKRYTITLDSTKEEIKEVLDNAKVGDLIRVNDDDYTTIVRRIYDVAKEYSITIEVVKIMPGTDLFTSVGRDFVIVTMK